MKRLLFIVMLVSGYISKSEAQSMLKVRTTDNKRINVMLDGRYFRKTGTSVTVGDLPYGRHRIKIFTSSYTRRGRAYEEVIYDGKLKTYLGMITLFVFDPNTGAADMQEQDINTYTSEHPIPNGYLDQKDDKGYNDAGDVNNNDNSSYPVASPVAAEEMSTLTPAKIEETKTKVAAKKTDTEKMKELKDALNTERVTTAQVSDMMDWLSFEATKAEFAQWAYKHVVDKDYYSDLVSKFTYKNYQDEMTKFINERK